MEINLNLGKDHLNWKKQFCVSLKTEHKESITALSEQVARLCVIATCLILGSELTGILKKEKKILKKNLRRGQGEGKGGSWTWRMQGSHAWVTAWNADGHQQAQGNAAGPVPDRPPLFRSGCKDFHVGLNFQNAGRLYGKKFVSLD